MADVRRLLVTGSASGIGAAVVSRAKDEGYDVIGVDLHQGEVVADLSTAAGRAGALASVRARTERLDAIVCCAGIAANEARTVSVNYFGTVELVTGLRPLLAQSRSPRVAVMGSITGTLHVDGGLVTACLSGDEPAAIQRAAELVDSGAGFGIYPASKHALARWARRTCVAPGWADAGIALNAVAPGTVLTPMTEPIVGDPAMKELMDATVPMPLNGYARPDAVASLLLWLVSADNTHVTGQVIYLDGGAEALTRGEERF